MKSSEPRILILGGSHSDIPLIKAAKSRGYFVITTGNRSYDLGHAYSDLYVPADYSNADEIYKIAREYSVSVVCPCCNDFAAISASLVAERLGLPGHDKPEVAKTIHHKDLWRKYANDNMIPSPRAVGLSDLADLRRLTNNLEFPLLVKPVDLTGGKGIQAVNSYSQAAVAVERALEKSKEKRVVIEEYISGTKHGFSAFLRNQAVVFWFVDNEQYHISPYLVSGASTPSSVSEYSIKALIKNCEIIAKSLGLVDGIFHVQFIERCPGNPVIIEICRRPPGDLYVELVRHATDAPYANWIIDGFSGSCASEVMQYSPKRIISRHCLMASTQGVFMGYEASCPNNIILRDGLVWGVPGQLITDPSTEKLGILLLEFSTITTYAEANYNLQDIFRCITLPL